jgi:hypothetical protein
MKASVQASQGTFSYQTLSMQASCLVVLVGESTETLSTSEPHRFFQFIEDYDIIYLV